MIGGYRTMKSEIVCMHCGRTAARATQMPHGRVFELAADQGIDDAREYRCSVCGGRLWAEYVHEEVVLARTPLTEEARCPRPGRPRKDGTPKQAMPPRTRCDGCGLEIKGDRSSCKACYAARAWEQSRAAQLVAILSDGQSWSGERLRQRLGCSHYQLHSALSTARDHYRVVYVNGVYRLDGEAS